MAPNERNSSYNSFLKRLIDESQQAWEDPYVFKNPIKSVAIIGAGPSGLLSAKHLIDANLQVRVFERNSEIGGVWSYSEKARPKPKMPSDRLTREIDPEALKVEAGPPQKRTYELTPEMNDFLMKKCPPSACYRDLHNNTPTKVFAPDYHQFPEDTPFWCPHDTTLNYLKSYADKFGLNPLIELNTSVDLVSKETDAVNGHDKWVLTLCKCEADTENGKVEVTRWRESFDAIVAASGVFQDPYIPNFHGLTAYNKVFPTKCSHSVQYRRPEDYDGKNVLVVGGSISAIDIVRALEGFASSITMSIRGPFISPIPIINIVRSKIPKSVNIKPNITAFANNNDKVDGTIQFEDGTSLKDIDNIIFCTGYVNRLTYFGDYVVESEQVLSSTDVDSVELSKNRIILGHKVPFNVYRDIFLISDPTVAFVGMVPSFSPIRHFDAQALAVARVWAGQAVLPNTKLMQKFTSEADFTPVTDPSGLNDGDRRMLDAFVVWLNCHAQKLANSNKGNARALSVVNNYPTDYEIQGKKAAELWLTVSDEILRKAKEKIRQHQL